MAATHGQFKDVRDIDGGATASLTLDASPTAGSTVAAVVWWANATSNLSAATIQGNAATLIGSVLEWSDRRSQAFYFPNVANAACTVAVTLDAAATDIRIVAHEILSADTANPLADSAAVGELEGTTNADAISAGTLTTTTDGSYFMGVTFPKSGTASTPGTDFSQGANQTTRESEYLEQVSAANHAVTFTAGGINDNWHTWGMVFVPASVAATTAQTMPAMTTATNYSTMIGRRSI